MNIMDLDEAEGLTAEMMCQYLSTSPAWRPRSSGAMFCDKHAGRSRLVWPSAVARDLGGTICDIAHAEQRYPQAILREMNPRMRKGLPSEPVRDAHAGRWVASRTDEYTHTTIVRFVVGMGGVVKVQFEDHRETFDPSAELDKWSFWPCDAHGNKVPWPAVSDAT